MIVIKEPVINVKDITFGYGSQRIFDKLNLQVDQGEFLGILGPNGSGKSTLLKVIMGFLKPQSGQVKLLGDPSNRFNRWQEVGYVSQKATSFNPGFPATVQEVIGTGLIEGKGFFKPWLRRDNARIDRALDLVGLVGKGRSMVGELSGGQQQRVFLARTLIRNPKLIILDEPTVGLDPKSYHQLAELLGRLNKDMDITILVVTHQLSCMVQHVDRVVYLEGGRLNSYNPVEYMARCQEY